jgi:acyl carrier protein
VKELYNSEIMETKTGDQIFDRIKEVIVEVLKVKENEITVKTNYKLDLEADSVDMADLLMALEDEFHMTIENEDLVKLQTVGETMQFISSRI